jgi:hypothetical protein
VSGLRRQLLYGRFLLLKYDRIVLERAPERLASRGKWLRRAFFLLQSFLESEDLSKVIEVIDQLKLAYGYGFLRPNESTRLTALIVRCLQDKRVDMATFLFDAFTPLIRSQSCEKIAAIFEQFTFISLVFAKHKQFFLCAKVANLILDVYDKNGCQLNEPQNQRTLTTGLTALQRMGSLAMRYDLPLFYEILSRTVALFKKSGLIIRDSEVSGLFLAWLHKAARNEQTEALRQIFFELEQLLRCGRITEMVLLEVIVEGENIAGTFSCQLFSPIGPLFIQQLLSLAYLSQSIGCMKQAIDCGGRVGYLAVHQNGFRKSFSLLRPLLDSGRKLFNEERKFGYSESNNGFRQKTLFYILKQNLAIAEYAARQEMTLTVGEVISWLLQSWQQQATVEESKKSIKWFSQLFYMYWHHVRIRQAKRSGLLDELMMPLLLTPEQVGWFLRSDTSL